MAFDRSLLGIESRQRTSRLSFSVSSENETTIFALAFADPDTQTGYAYAPNQAGVYPFDDPREKALRDAYYGCLQRLQ